MSHRVITVNEPIAGLFPCSVTIDVDRQGRMTITAADADQAVVLQAVLDAAYMQVEDCYLHSLGLDDAGRSKAAARRREQRIHRLGGDERSGPVMLDSTSLTGPAFPPQTGPDYRLTPDGERY